MGALIDAEELFMAVRELAELGRARKMPKGGESEVVDLNAYRVRLMSSEDDEGQDEPH